MMDLMRIVISYKSTIICSLIPIVKKVGILQIVLASDLQFTATKSRFYNKLKENIFKMLLYSAKNNILKAGQVIHYLLAGFHLFL